MFSETIFDKYGIHNRLSIIYTLKCNFKCTHCILNCGPVRNEKMKFQTAKKILTVSSSNHKNYVIFSGGEIFLFYKELLMLSEYGSQLGYIFGIETNGYWATSNQTVKKLLDPLKKNKLSEIYLSIDSYHLPYVPVEYQMNIINYCKENDIDYEVSFCPSANQESDNKILSLLKQKDIKYSIEMLLNVGRANSIQDYETYTIYDLKYCDSFCTTFLPNGEMYACCDITDSNQPLKDTPMYLGNVETDDIDYIYKNTNLKLLHKLFDINYLYNFKSLPNTAEFIKFKSRKYFNICNFCHQFFKDQECINSYSKLTDYQ